MGLLGPGMPASCCCCCGALMSCCVPPTPTTELDLVALPCSGFVFDGAAPAVNAGELTSVNDYFTALADLVTLTDYLPAEPVSWSSRYEPLGCPAVVMPAIGSGKAAGPGGVAMQATVGHGSVWMLVTVPSWPEAGGTASIMSASASGPLDLFQLAATNGTLSVSNGDLSLVEPIGLVAAGQVLLVGLEVDSAGSYRVWVNGVEYPSPGFGVGCTCDPVWASGVAEQGEFGLYFAGVSFGSWAEAVDAMSSWATLVGLDSVLEPLEPPPD